mmetsp:Transcript_3578/g.8978  ORF Transcript_3578/g.8978 Transcript_3578/m.8978 type:complete len:218 (+) Transcript_3578:833-1486(+)
MSNSLSLAAKLRCASVAMLSKAAVGVCHILNSRLARTADNCVASCAPKCLDPSLEKWSPSLSQCSLEADHGRSWPVSTTACTFGCRFAHCFRAELTSCLRSLAVHISHICLLSGTVSRMLFVPASWQATCSCFTADTTASGCCCDPQSLVPAITMAKSTGPSSRKMRRRPFPVLPALSRRLSWSMLFTICPAVKPERPQTKISTAICGGRAFKSALA